MSKQKKWGAKKRIAHKKEMSKRNAPERRSRAKLEAQIIAETVASSAECERRRRREERGERVGATVRAVARQRITDVGHFVRIPVREAERGPPRLSTAACKVGGLRGRRKKTGGSRESAPRMVSACASAAMRSAWAGAACVAAARTLSELLR